ncbi:2-isopropylmalate synthase [Variovorax sp. SRS16]|uniref:2-isopropylmalate synthase n=1 Tax=Variovorax sp. SRS16 TaxID=282217 RepID=UPI001317CD3A|nr:2-isopropylmalate synthase [Variovorax sp. SRS16]VTU16865.1 2-isopropylmalate synthase [Variovorax sp. SRS16]
MISNPAEKYRRLPVVDLPDRQWPSRTIDRPPVWLATDLRDGNQALFEPMNRDRKMRLFRELVRIGFKEIEVGFPATSQIDFDVVRELIEDGHVPADVTPMVMTQIREDLIARTVESLRGAPRAIVHLYNATAPVWRKVVFGMSVPQVMQLVERHVLYLKRLTDAAPQTQWILQYSPETFCMTELEVALEACNTAIRAWDAGPQRPVIVNLPTTVEVTTANVFADQIEWMHRHLERRAHVVLSVHPHNDRGTGVASAEQALMAGAERIEGCLFGNGERSGNVDLVTLALNLYTHGVHPGLDFSEIASIARIAEECTSVPIHPRHPYVGDLVFTAFSGSHQDAIKKGFAAQAEDGPWQVPYLPIDPKDLGRTYDSIVRVNSQSGKGGIASLLERDHGVVMPRRMQVEFSAIVQKAADASEAEVSGSMLWALFEQTYLAPAVDPEGSLVYRGHRLFDDPAGQGIELDLVIDARPCRVRGVGTGPLEATVHALGTTLRVDSFEERSLGQGAEASALAIVEMAMRGVNGTRFGVGRNVNTLTALVQAVISAVARLKAESSGTAAVRTGRMPACL